MTACNAALIGVLCCQPMLTDSVVVLCLVWALSSRHSNVVIHRGVHLFLGQAHWSTGLLPPLSHGSRLSSAVKADQVLPWR